MAKEEHKKQPTSHAHRKVFDVTRPGKAIASPTSRPVVTTPKNPVADDQFVPSAPLLRAGNPFAKHDLMDPKKRKDLQPLNAPDQAEPEATAPGAPALSTSEAASAAPSPDAPVLPTSELATGEDIAAGAAAPTGSEVSEANPSSTAAPTQQPELEVPTSPELTAPEPETKTTAPAVSVPSPWASPDAISGPEQAEKAPATSASVAATPTAAEPSAEPEPKKDIPIWEHPDTSEQVESESTRPHLATRSNKSIEDLLAETGAPQLEPEKAPSLIVSHHHNGHHNPWLSGLVGFVIVTVLALIALNFLLDADIIKTSLNLPHTNFFR